MEVSVDLLSKCNIQAAKHLTSLWAAVSYALNVSPQLGSYEALPCKACQAALHQKLKFKKA
ncbi:MAG: hypothetical protein EAZ73_24745 [Oscillatoriales cyanobacterium]|nr:MAG: hypothetical protein EAZ83_23480 [Oscillatoriales cyanobacterium]TAF16390.1 MAG: hypothetical protein EAZ73_24745 [Oscillatoriales cyanobacterium]TAF29665.1 MAG: hypothetical protein EAZ69_24495 [Oscillatoriales cyanobacterium]